MNDLTSRQRKLVYAGGILVLLVPIILLGAPTSEDVVPGSKAQVSGGLLAQMRVEHDLGESTLGEIDPSSAAMNLVLLGLRGPAAGVLHLQALEYQEKKDWAKLKTTVDSIIKLQPHYVEIWKFQGWNLSFNVSREWDQVADRFFWVKEGIKFLQLGTSRNQTATMLFYNVGDFMGRKFGNSDEKKFFRAFFKSDPDPKFAEGADPEINPEAKDNYLVAKDWFKEANVLDKSYRIEGMTHVFARQGPARASFDYANAQQSEGAFGEENRIAWDDAYNEWTNVYGNDIFLGLNDVQYKLNCTEEELEDLAKQNGVTLATQRKVWEQNVKMVNFRFWRNYADCERDPMTVAAHKAIYDGKVAYKKGETSDSQDKDGQEEASKAELLFYKGMEGMRDVFKKYPELAFHDLYIEEAMLAVHYWKTIKRLNGKAVPQVYPLAPLVIQNSYRQADVEREFLIESVKGLNL